MFKSFHSKNTLTRNMDSYEDIYSDDFFESEHEDEFSTIEEEVEKSLDDLSGSEDRGDTFDNKEKRKICFENNVNSDQASENSGSSNVSTPEVKNKQGQDEKQDEKVLDESQNTKVFAPRIKPMMTDSTKEGLNKLKAMKDKEMLNLELLTRRMVSSPYFQESRRALLNPSFHSCVELRSSTDQNDSLSKGNVINRVNSAKRRWDKEKQNSTEFLQMQIKALKDENRILNRLVKRQGSALERLVGAQGELPSLLHAHNEETRILKHKMKQAQELNKQFAQKIRERDNIIIRVREANKQLKADSNNQNGFLNKTKPGVKKGLINEQSSQSVEEMESEIDDLKSQLEGRDDEVKNLMHKVRVMEKSSRQRISNDNNASLQMKKKLEEAEKKIERLNKIIQEKDKIIYRNNIYSHRRHSRMSNETLNRSSASPSLTSKQISMSSMDISSLVNEPTMKASQSFDITNIEDEESQGDTKVHTYYPATDFLPEKSLEKRNGSSSRIAGRKKKSSPSLSKNIEAGKKKKEIVEIPQKEIEQNEPDKNVVSDSSLIDDKTYPVVDNDNESCASSDNEASLTIDNFQSKQNENSVSFENPNAEISTLPDVVDFKDHNDRNPDENQHSNSTAIDDQKNDKDISKDDEKEADESFQKHVTFDILSPVPFMNETENGIPYEPLNSIKDADNVSVDEDIGDDFYDNLEDPLDLSHDSSGAPESFKKGKRPINKLNTNEDEENSESSNSEGSKKEINMINRQNSFRATRNFFANQGGGLIISPKEYKKNSDRESKIENNKNTNQPRPLSNKEKLELWLPNGLAAPKSIDISNLANKASSSNSNIQRKRTSISKTSNDFDSVVGSGLDSTIQETKIKMEALDMNENTSFPNRTLPKDLYEPSFNSRKTIRNEENNTFINLRDSPFLNDDFNQIDNPFLSSNFNKEKQSKSPTDSISTTSSIKSDLETRPTRRHFI